MTTAYSTITETPGIGASREQLAMLYSRYRFAAEWCAGRDVLEVACGAGQGLGYLARRAKRVVGGDVDQANLTCAAARYSGRPQITVQQFDAHQFPFPDASFDTAICFEAIYYFARPDIFLRECRRILRPHGVLIICSVNCKWSDFNPSPFHTRYFSAAELESLMRAAGFRPELFLAFPVQLRSWRSRILSRIKRAAVVLHLIPKTMRGKEWLKRVVFGPLTPLPAEVADEMAPYVQPVAVATDGPHERYKVMYAVGYIAERTERA